MLYITLSMMEFLCKISYKIAEHLKSNSPIYADNDV